MDEYVELKSVSGLSHSIKAKSASTDTTWPLNRAQIFAIRKLFEFFANFRGTNQQPHADIQPEIARTSSFFTFQSPGEHSPTHANHQPPTQTTKPHDSEIAITHQQLMDLLQSCDMPVSEDICKEAISALSDTPSINFEVMLN